MAENTATLTGGNKQWEAFPSARAKDERRVCICTYDTKWLGKIAHSDGEPRAGAGDGKKQSNELLTVSKRSLQSNELPRDIERTI